MRNISLINGSAAAVAAMILAASVTSSPVTFAVEPARPKSRRRFVKHLVNNGPVIDTTKESKRAKRRRLAHQSR